MKCTLHVEIKVNKTVWLAKKNNDHTTHKKNLNKNITTSFKIDKQRILNKKILRIIETKIKHSIYYKVQFHNFN